MLAVTGAGFVSGSTVNLDGSPRTTTFVSSSKLTANISAADLVDARTVTVTVVSPGPGGGISNAQSYSIATFLQQLSWSSLSVVRNEPITSPLAAGDFTDDGYQDIAGAIGSVIYVLPGNGDGTFQSPHGTQGPSGSTITSVNVVDVNGDGRLDLIVTGSKSSTVSFVATMVGNGDGTFQLPIETDFSGVHFPSRPIVADLNGDGVLDLAYTSASGVQTILGNGDGTFRTGPSTAISQIGLGVVAVGDFNNDGIVDLVLTVYDPFTTGLEYVGVMLGNGDGTFGALSQVSGTATAFTSGLTAAVGDFNNDGNLDIATGIQTSGSSIQGYLLISLGGGNGTFQAAYSVPNVNSITTPLLVADFNGDGNLDLLTGGYSYMGQGNGSFVIAQASAGLIDDVVVADFNNDGRPDVLNETFTTSGNTVLTSVGLFLQVPPKPDFTGIVTPFSSTLVPGGSVSLQSTVEPLNGFTGDVIVAISNLPNGISVNYNPTVIHGGSGTTTITLTAASTLALGDYTVTLSGSSGTLVHSTTMTLVVNDSVGDWTGSVDQIAENIAPGATAAYTITAVPIGGFTGNIALSASGLPAGATASFNPPTIAGGSGSTILSVATSSTTPQPAITNITVTGTNGILVHNTSVYLGVRTGTGDFTGTLSPTQASIASAGGTVSYALTVTPLNGGAGDLALTVNGLPPGATASFSPATIPASSGSSTLTIDVASGTPTGSYQINVSSTGSGVIHESSVTLTVTP
ncbi:MAG: FG-GAP-like repeat-containing protein [Candidatus Acidiferrum sp.]